MTGRFSYQQGIEYGPGGIFGAYTLSVDPGSEDATLERRTLGVHESWQLRIAPAWRQAVVDALAASPFPRSEVEAQPPDTVWRTIESDDQRYTITWQTGIDDPGWAPLFELLDGLCWLVAPPRVPGVRLPELDPSWLLAEPRAS